MHFTYFKGPNSDMTDLLEGPNICSICKKEHDYCFALEFATIDKFPEGQNEGKIGCYECLKNGEFEFWHDTEFGLLDQKGLTKVYKHNIENPPHLSDGVLTEMRRTPQFISYQQELWLTHCNDFMIYQGTWEPLDFYKNSSTGDGRELFMQMTDEEMNHLWDNSLQDGQTLLEVWHPTYYVFECKHCGKLRGNWDCD